MAGTPFMSLTLPVPGVTGGPAWASQINTALTAIDAHDHTGSAGGSIGGVQIRTAALRLDADLAFNLTATSGLNAIGLRTTRFVSQSAALTASTDVACLYVSGNNLFYNNGSGQAVQITAGAALSATSLGGISGLPSGTASAAFTSQTFTWRSATNTAATMDTGPLAIRDSALGALAITFGSPIGLAAGYSLSLPTALPASTKLLSLSSAGAMAFADVDNSTLQNSSGTLSIKSVPRTTLPAVGQQVSSSCGAFTTASTSYVDVTNLTVTMTTTGRPVMLVLQPDTSGTPAFCEEQGAGNQTLQLALLRDGSVIGAWKFQITASTNLIIYGSAMAYLDSGASAAAHTWKVQALTTPSGTGAVQNYLLAAYEL